MHILRTNSKYVKNKKIVYNTRVSSKIFKKNTNSLLEIKKRTLKKTYFLRNEEQKGQVHTHILVYFTKPYTSLHILCVFFIKL